MKSPGLAYSIKNRENSINSQLQSPFHDHPLINDRRPILPDAAADVDSFVDTDSQRSPRPHASLATRAKDFFAGRRPTPRVASSTSLHSSYSTHSARAQALAAARSQEHLPVPPSQPPPVPRPAADVHPYAAMVASPVPVVSSHDAEDEKECPVCLEPLSFSFRLPGEKPHIVPDCGHALHEVCVMHA